MVIYTMRNGSNFIFSLLGHLTILQPFAIWLHNTQCCIILQAGKHNDTDHWFCWQLDRCSSLGDSEQILKLSEHHYMELLIAYTSYSSCEDEISSYRGVQHNAWHLEGPKNVSCYHFNSSHLFEMLLSPDTFLFGSSPLSGLYNSF